MKSKSGFSLLELAIVILIVGLLIGALTVGRGVLHNARLHSVMSEINDYRSTFKLFRDKYHGWPGDLYNAQTLWGADPAGCPATPNTTLKIETCNGNGDNHIVGTEAFRAWQHLANAGFIKGRYTGADATATAGSARLGITIPQSGMSAVGYYVYYHANAPINGNPAVTVNPGWGALAANYVDVVGLVPGSNLPTDAKFSASDALSIDQKADDGLPGQGAVLATPGGNCTTMQPGGTLDPVTEKYSSSSSEAAACMLSVMLGVE